MQSYVVIFAPATVQASSLAEAVATATAEAIQVYKEGGSTVAPLFAAAALPATVVEGAAAGAGAPLDFQVGSSYKSDTGKWTGRITEEDEGLFTIALRNRNGETEEREFERTANGNLRSIEGSIVFRAVNKVG